MNRQLLSESVIGSEGRELVTDSSGIFSHGRADLILHRWFNCRAREMESNR